MKALSCIAEGGQNNSRNQILKEQGGQCISNGLLMIVEVIYAAHMKWAWIMFELHDHISEPDSYTYTYMYVLATEVQLQYDGFNSVAYCVVLVYVCKSN